MISGHAFPETLGPYVLARFTEALRSENIVELHLVYHTVHGARIDAVAAVNRETYVRSRETVHAALIDQARAQSC